MSDPTQTSDSGITKEMAEHVGYFIVYVNRGDWHAAGVHDRLLRTALFCAVAERLQGAADAVKLLARRAPSTRGDS